MAQPLPEPRLSALSLPPHLRPNLLGIGAAKAGTTSLAEAIARHPDIFMPPQKELNCLHYADLDERLGEYAGYFRDGRDFRIRCDFSVRYLASPQAPAAAARLAPDAKILVVLRNPVDQVQSHYWHLLRQNFHQPSALRRTPDLFEALERFPALLRVPALYGKHLSRWFDHFARSAFYVVDYADTVRNLPNVLVGLYRFLELPIGDAASDAVAATSAPRRRGVQPRGGVLGWIYPRVYSIAAHGPFQWLKRAAGVAAADRLKRSLRLRESAEAIFFKPGYPELDADGRRRLYALFQDDIAALARLDLMDVRAWSPQ
ncbi:MAG: sulfotransferase [Vitreimonas sp.]